MDERLSLHFIGTGTIAPHPERSCSSILVRYLHQNILIDAGAGTLRRLALEGFNPHEIDLLFVTHYHPDHVGDIVPLIFSIRNTREMAIERKSLKIFGPPGLYRFLHGMQRAYGGWMQKAAEEVRFYEIKRSEIEFPGFRLSWQHVVHNQESIALRFDFGGYSIAYSGDSGYCQSLVKVCHQADLAIIECSHADENAVKGHLSPSLAAQVAQKANAKRLVLTHFYPDVLQSDFINIARKYFSGEIVAAYDGLKLVLIK